MSINLLRQYIEDCNTVGIEPSWAGLKSYKQAFKESLEAA